MGVLYMNDFSILFMKIGYVDRALALANISMKNYRRFIRNSNRQYINIRKINY